MCNVRVCTPLCARKRYVLVGNVLRLGLRGCDGYVEYMCRAGLIRATLLAIGRVQQCMMHTAESIPLHMRNQMRVKLCAIMEYQSIPAVVGIHECVLIHEHVRIHDRCVRHDVM